jgi:hypothetical protein
MSKLTAVLSKKVPIPGFDYSIQQFTCGLEIELPAEDKQDDIRERIRHLYAFLHDVVNGEIRDSVNRLPELPAEHQSQTPVRNGRRWSGSYQGGSQRGHWGSPHGGGPRRYNGGGRATQAQVKAIFGIAKSLGMPREELLQLMRERFQTDEAEQLGVRQASQFIEYLKEGVKE